MATFAYKGDVGQHSYLAIEAVARASYPDLKPTSDFRPGSITITGNVSYHSRGNAVDFVSSKARMIEFARWIYTAFAPYTLELIHAGGGGIYVHNGVKDFKYSAPVVQEHYNHVHWAITNNGLHAAGAGNSSDSSLIPVSNPVTDDKASGCMVPAMILLFAGGGTLWTATELALMLGR